MATSPARVRAPSPRLPSGRPRRSWHRTPPKEAGHCDEPAEAERDEHEQQQHREGPDEEAEQESRTGGVAPAYVSRREVGQCADENRVGLCRARARGPTSSLADSGAQMTGSGRDDRATRALLCTRGDDPCLARAVAPGCRAVRRARRSQVVPVMDRTAIEDDLLRLERALADRNPDGVPEGLLSLLAEEFMEIGRSGRIWTKGSIAALLQSGPAPIPTPFEDFRVDQLSPGLCLVTYRGAMAIRSSIWVLRDGRWQMRFHQGTPLPVESVGEQSS